jgi:hypothetical protein
VKLLVMVNCGLTSLSKLVAGASDLLVEIFGEERQARPLGGRDGALLSGSPSRRGSSRFGSLAAGSGVSSL